MLSNKLSAVATHNQTNLSALLHQLAASGYCLQVKDNSLLVSHPKYPLPTQLLQCLKKDKATIIQLLKLNNVHLVNGAKASKPVILFSVWEVSLIDNQPITVISRDDHMLQSMTKALHRQFGAHRIASITMRSCYAK